MNVTEKIHDLIDRDVFKCWNSECRSSLSMGNIASIEVEGWKVSYSCPSCENEGWRSMLSMEGERFEAPTIDINDTNLSFSIYKNGMMLNKIYRCCFCGTEHLGADMRLVRYVSEDQTVSDLTYEDMSFSCVDCVASHVSRCIGCHQIVNRNYYDANTHYCFLCSSIRRRSPIRSSVNLHRRREEINNNIINNNNNNNIPDLNALFGDNNGEENLPDNDMITLDDISDALDDWEPEPEEELPEPEESDVHVDIDYEDEPDDDVRPNFIEIGEYASVIERRLERYGLAPRPAPPTLAPMPAPPTTPHQRRDTQERTFFTFQGQSKRKNEELKRGMTKKKRTIEDIASDPNSEL